ncbi:hypothetical protein FC093_07650 [Ilyomonas limi]|uniref:Uncharacterized protein n=1 Tax=Ilyomonas limi TaxID=2575867 RepID=A0A4U3L4M4_9BACT|nr:hypothetical protein [Ilyomonas limi]TKK69940.1 hypothetical protein FC093_07650 [Ilyomonas limi]
MSRFEPEKKLNKLKEGVQMLVTHFFLCLTMLNKYVPDDFTDEKQKLVGDYIHTKIFAGMPFPAE